MTLLHYFFDLTSFFMRLGQKSWKKFRCFLEDLKTPKGHFEINWPLKTLVERCNKITELDLGSTNITKESVGSIVTHLKSLEKLDVSYTKIDSTAIHQLGSVKTLMFLRWQNIEIDKNIDQIRNLKKKLPQLSINANYLSNIATSTSNTVQYEDGFWEIKARSQELFLK